MHILISVTEKEMVKLDFDVVKHLLNFKLNI